MNRVIPTLCVLAMCSMQAVQDDHWEIVHIVPIPVSASLLKERADLATAVAKGEAQIEAWGKNPDSRDDQRSMREFKRGHMENQRLLRDVQMRIDNPDTMLFCYQPQTNRESVLRCEGNDARRAIHVEVGDIVTLRIREGEVIGFAPSSRPDHWTPAPHPADWVFAWDRVPATLTATATGTEDGASSWVRIALKWQREPEWFLEDAPQLVEWARCDVWIGDGAGNPYRQLLKDVDLVTDFVKGVATTTVPYSVSLPHPGREYVVQNIRTDAHYFVNWTAFRRQ